ncbi:MAG: radical SAM protein [Elusimicrobiota bacterium]
MHIQFINVVGGDFSALDIAITNLATYLNERTTHRASIVDLTFHRHHWKKHLRKGIEKHKPDVIGFSTNTMYMQYVKEVVEYIKKDYQLPIILGGAHASIHPEKTLLLPGVDAVCVGDGEFVLAEYLNRLSANKSLEGVAGLWIKDRERIVKNEGGSFIKNIDDLPLPNWDLWEDLDEYFYFLGMLYIQGSRGCPYKCTYCDAHGIADAVQGDYFRFRDPVKYAQEIAYQWGKYQRRNLRLAQLFDPVFTIKDQWLTAFCQEYSRLGMNNKLRFSAFSRIDHLDEKKIKLLSRSGCALLRVGLEAGDENIRNEVYKKKISNRQIRSIFKLAKQYGIGFTAFYILGGPGEDRSTLQRTLDLALELDANRSAFFIYKPFTKEGLEQITRYGGKIDEERWQKADNITFGAVVQLPDLSLAQIEWFQKKAYFLTFGRRLLRMLIRLKWRYFIHLAIYLCRGLRQGLDWRYLLIYFHIYAYDNIDK